MKFSKIERCFQDMLKNMSTEQKGQLDSIGYKQKPENIS